MRPRSYRLLALLLAAALSGAVSAQGHQEFAAKDERVTAAARSIREAGGTETRIRISRATGTAKWLDFGVGGIAVPAGKGERLEPEGVVDRFLDGHGAVLGVRTPSVELRTKSSEVDELGVTHIIRSQIYKDVPVFGAELRFAVTRDQRVRAVSGLFVPDLTLDTTPSIAVEQAIEIAVASARAVAPAGESISAMDFGLTVFQDGLSRDVREEAFLTWQVIVSSDSLQRRVFVDAHTGEIRAQHEMLWSIDRQMYLTGSESNGGPTFASWCTARKCEFSGLACSYNEQCTGGTVQQPERCLDYCVTASSTGVVATNTTCTQDSNPTQHSDLECTTTCASYEHPDCVWRSTSAPQPDETFECDSSYPNCAFDPEAGEQSVTRMMRTTGESYNFFKNLGHQSWDGDDGPMHGVVQNYPLGQLPCAPSSPIALMRPHMNPYTHQLETVSAEFCPQLAYDDVIAHEWAHGVTFATSNLVYEQQPGALNESFSDIWGEVVDRLNSNTPLDDALRSPETCSLYTLPSAPGDDNSTRWLLGEDTPIGAIRDMWNPNCYDHPGAVTDDEYYCPQHWHLTPERISTFVHTNSGVPNHAFALIVDGTRDSTSSIPSGIGLTKAAHIYWRAQNYYHGTYSDFGDHADALELACNELIGQSLTELAVDTPPSSSPEQITAGDCAVVTAAIDIVEMRVVPVYSWDTDDCEFGLARVKLYGPGGELAPPYENEDPPGYVTGYSASGTQDIALPYVLNPALQKASDLRQDMLYALPAGAYVTVSRYNPTTGGLDTYYSFAPRTDFDLVPGEGYRVRIAVSSTFERTDYLLDGFDPPADHVVTLAGPDAGQATRKHFYAPPLGSSAETASDLRQLLLDSGATVAKVSKFNRTNDLLDTYEGGAGEIDFALRPGVAYWVEIDAEVSFMPLADLNEAPVFEEVVDLVNNGDFSNGTQGWSFYTNADTTFSVTGGEEAKIAVNTAGTNVQLYQHSLTLQGGTTYRLSFDARNTGGDNVKVRVIRHSSPYTDYGLTQVFNLTTAMQTFTTTFTTPTGTLEPARLMFWIAPYDTAGNDYYFDNISIVEE